MVAFCLPGKGTLRCGLWCQCAVVPGVFDDGSERTQRLKLLVRADMTLSKLRRGLLVFNSHFLIFRSLLLALQPHVSWVPGRCHRRQPWALEGREEPVSLVMEAKRSPPVSRLSSIKVCKKVHCELSATCLQVK